MPAKVDYQRAESLPVTLITWSLTSNKGFHGCVSPQDKNTCKFNEIHECPKRLYSILSLKTVSFWSKGALDMAWTPRNLKLELKRARLRIGSTRAAQAAWLLRLTQLPKYEYLTSTQEEALRWELGAFLHGGEATERKTSVWLSRVQGGFRAFNNKVKAWKQWTVRVGEYRTAVIDDNSLIFKVLPPKKSQRDEIADDVYKALCTLDNLLARCPRSRCRAYFIRVRRQRYCTPQCAAKVRLRRFREKHRS